MIWLTCCTTLMCHVPTCHFKEMCRLDVSGLPQLDRFIFVYDWTSFWFLMCDAEKWKFSKLSHRHGPGFCVILELGIFNQNLGFCFWIFVILMFELFHGCIYHGCHDIIILFWEFLWYCGVFLFVLNGFPCNKWLFWSFGVLLLHVASCFHEWTLSQVSFIPIRLPLIFQKKKNSV